MWVRTFSSTNSDIRGQLVAGTLVGGTIFFGSQYVAWQPRVANLSTRDRFGVAWFQQSGPLYELRFETVEAATGALGNHTMLQQVFPGSDSRFDLGCETAAPTTSARGFLLVYDDWTSGSVRGVRMWFDAFDVFQRAPTQSVLAGTATYDYGHPALSRAAASDGRLLLVARRQQPALAASAIVAVVVGTNGVVHGTPIELATSAADDLQLPDVDGYADRWVAAWERTGAYDAVGVAPVTGDAATAALQVGAATTFGGSPLVRASAPTVG